MVVDHKEKNVIFMIKKIVVLTSIWMISSRKQKNFANKTENSIEIKRIIWHFWLIMKGIQKMILMMLIKKQII